MKYKYRGAQYEYTMFNIATEYSISDRFFFFRNLTINVHSLHVTMKYENKLRTIWQKYGIKCLFIYLVLQLYNFQI